MDKPYVKLFRTPNCTYVFDVNKDEFVQIDKNSYEFLSNLLREESDAASLSEVPNEIIKIEIPKSVV